MGIVKHSMTHRMHGGLHPLHRRGKEVAGGCQDVWAFAGVNEAILRWVLSPRRALRTV